MVDGAFDAAKKAMTSEDSMHSLVGSLLSRECPKEMTREEYEYTIKWAAGSLYGGMYHRFQTASRACGLRFLLSSAGTESVSVCVLLLDDETMSMSVLAKDDVKHHHILVDHGALPGRAKAGPS
jgi:hypothetical protein